MGAQQLGLGIDVVDVARFSAVVALRGPDLCHRVFTPRELDDCHGSARRLAGRLAAKEAAAKALGTGIGPIAWRDVEVRTGASGEPDLVIRGSARDAATRRGFDHWAVSLTHDGTHALAVVMAVPDDRRTGR